MANSLHNQLRHDGDISANRCSKATNFRRGFTLIEIIATLMLLTFGIMSAIGMAHYAMRQSAEFVDQATAMATAETFIIDPQPPGVIDFEIIASSGRPDIASTRTQAADNDIGYKLHTQGTLNGFFVQREERSWIQDDNVHYYVNGIDGDGSTGGNSYIGSKGMRWAQVTVHVFAGGSDRYLTTVRRRVLRRMAGAL